MPNVTIYLMEQDHLSNAHQLNLWDSGIEMKDILTTHHDVLKVGTLTLWGHVDDKHNAPINTVVQEAK